MGAVSVVYTHQLLQLTSSFGSQCNKLRDVRETASTSVIVSRATGIKSPFGGRCEVRQRSRRLSFFHSTSRSHATHLCRSQLTDDFTAAASAVYGVLLLGGGLFAYTKSGSKGSLFRGLTGATLMSIAYYLMQTSEMRELGDAIAFGASLLFTFIFGIRFTATRKIIPAGLLLGVSVSLMALAFSAYLQDRI